MLIASSQETLPLAGGVLPPQARFLDEDANPREERFQRLLLQQASGGFNRHGQNQLEVLAIAKGTIERSRCVLLSQRESRDTTGMAAKSTSARSHWLHRPALNQVISHHSHRLRHEPARYRQATVPREPAE